MPANVQRAIAALPDKFMKATEPEANSLLRGWRGEVRRLVVFVVGMTVLLIGVVMMATPGPAVLVIPLGLGILAIEFAWARRLLRRVKERIAAAARTKPQETNPEDRSAEGRCEK